MWGIWGRPQDSRGERPKTPLQLAVGKESGARGTANVMPKTNVRLQLISISHGDNLNMQGQLLTLALQLSNATYRRGP